MKKHIFIILLLFSSNSYSVNLLGVPELNEVSYNGPTNCLAWVYGESAEGEKPECSTYERLVFDFCTDQGKAWLSIILAYNAQNKTMKIMGSGDCNLQSSTESVQYLRLKDGG